MTLRKLIKKYQNHPLSTWHALRYSTQQNHRNLLRQIDRRYGRVKLRRIKAKTLLEWHGEWLDGTKFSAARAFIKKVRTVFGFGMTLLEDEDCVRIRQVMTLCASRVRRAGNSASPPDKPSPCDRARGPGAEAQWPWRRPFSLTSCYARRT
ncbi:hypothetical protein [Bradyrhizobium sp. 174]|uniref:hypothetical protein n=1 Tax=Bradyrhizobium sp. 174 TaxID=2782645 RepID=UPI001FFC09A2|nr:hypothetical protein [Bradyrhizobium sp. 174]MCK1577789.1 hypothetical protein [Bradyrhizobium sp. 174]